MNRYHQAVAVYTFQASSYDEKLKWMKNLKKARDEVSNEKISTSTKELSSDEEFLV